MESARPKLPSIFVDSSAFFAACISPTGGAHELFVRSRDGEVILVASPLVLRETERNLAAKAPWGYELFASFRESGLILIGPEPDAERIIELSSIVDPKDAPIVAAATQAQVTYLATHDARHLIAQADVLRESYGIVVASPGDILQELRIAEP